VLHKHAASRYLIFCVSSPASGLIGITTKYVLYYYVNNNSFLTICGLRYKFIVYNKNMYPYFDSQLVPPRLWCAVGTYHEHWKNYYIIFYFIRAVRLCILRSFCTYNIVMLSKLAMKLAPAEILKSFCFLYRLSIHYNKKILLRVSQYLYVFYF